MGRTCYTIISKCFRTIITVALCILLLSAALPIGFAAEGTSAEYDFEGAGTKEEPFRISSYEDLSKLRDRVDSGISYEGIYFEQTQDIEFANINWDPIGDLSELKGFSGSYDGHGHVLKNICSEDQYAGLFSWLDGEVRNLGIESGSFKGETVGSITSHGSYRAKIINCFNKATVTGTTRAGGLADNYAGMILFSWNLGEVEGTADTALTAGISSYGGCAISNCYSVTAPLTCDDTFSGTITGSRTISREELRDLTLQTYYDVGKYSDSENVAYGNLFLPVCRQGQFVFTEGRIPQEYRDIEAARFLEVTGKKYSFSGSGTKEDPFRIEDLEDLKLLRDCVDYGISYKGFYFAQTADITFPEDENWDSIGEMKKLIPFSGTYDGRGHVMKNIHCEDKYAGLFAWLDGEVRNLGIESGTFQGDTVGSITSHGPKDGRIINCYNKATVIGSSRAGGLTDNFNGEILFSWNLGKVKGTSEDTVTAGIASYTAGTLEGNYTLVGPALDEKTCTGTVLDCDVVKKNDIGECLEKNYEKMRADYEDLSTGEILKMTWEDDQLVFTETPVDLSRQDGNYLVLVSLSIAAVLLAIICIIRLSLARGKQTDSQDTKVRTQPAENLETAEKPQWNKQILCQRALSVVLVISMFLGAFAYSNEVLTHKTNSGIASFSDFMKTETKPDVLFLGASTVTWNIELASLWKDFGIAGACLGVGGCSTYDHYYRLLEAERYCEPKLVVLEVCSVVHETEYRSQETKMASLAGLNLSWNKLKLLQVSVEPEYRMEYLLNLPMYHARYSELTKRDFPSESKSALDRKGYWSTAYTSEYVPTLIDASAYVEYRAISDKQEYYLRKIIEHCKDSCIDLLLLKTTDADRVRDQSYFNTVALIAEEYQVPFLDMNYFDEEIGLRSSDFSIDGRHLDMIGSRKSTLVFGEYLEEHYDLPDRREDADYVSWDRFAANRDTVYMLQIRNNNEDYLAELARNEKKLIMFSYKWTEEDAEDSEAYQELEEALNELDYDTWEPKGKAYGPDPETLTLGSNEITIQRDYAACTMEINGKEEVTVSSPGIVLLVYDPLLDEVADVVCFTKNTGFVMQRLYYYR